MKGEILNLKNHYSQLKAAGRPPSPSQPTPTLALYLTPSSRPHHYRQTARKDGQNTSEPTDSETPEPDPDLHLA